MVQPQSYPPFLNLALSLLSRWSEETTASPLGDLPLPEGRLPSVPGCPLWWRKTALTWAALRASGLFSLHGREKQPGFPPFACHSHCPVSAVPGHTSEPLSTALRWQSPAGTPYILWVWGNTLIKYCSVEASCVFYSSSKASSIFFGYKPPW